MPKLDYSTDEQRDERLNPASSELSARESAAFDQIAASNHDLDEQGSQEMSNMDKSSKTLGEKENSAGKNSGFYESSGGGGKAGVSKGLMGKILSKKGGAATVIGLVFGGGAFMISSIAPGFAAIHFVETVAEDLDDKLASLEITESKIFKGKLISGARSGALSGCTKMSLGCKMRTFSKSEVARMKRAGIELIDTNDGPLGRTRAKGVKFQGKEYTPAQWASELKNNPKARQAQLRANNMRYRGLSSRGPFGKILKRFGVSKKSPGLKGSKQDRINQLLTSSSTSDPAKIKLVDIVDDDGNPVTDEQGNPKKALEDESIRGKVEDGKIKQSNITSETHTYSGADLDKVTSTIDQATKTKPLSSVRANAAKAASVLGYADLACSIKNMVHSASTAAKIANESQLIKYAMGILPVVGKMKAGEASVEEVDTIMTLLTEADGRPEIKDVVEVNGEITEGLKPNPNYKKSAMDSRLLQMSSSGVAARQTSTMSMFSLGVGMEGLLSAAGVGLDIANTIDNVGGQQLCSFVQNPVVRLAGIGLSIAGGVATGGGSVALQLAISAGMVTAVFLLDVYLNNALSGDISSSIESSPIARGEALWTGVAALESNAARASGLVPANTETFAEYNSLNQQIKNEYTALEMEDAKQDPLNPYNRYSLLGNIVNSVNSSTKSKTSPLGIVSGILSTPAGTYLNKASAKSNAFNKDRLKYCKDEQYTSIGIEPDIQCNIRYVSYPEDLKREFDDVEEYMISTGNIEEDSVNGIPKGYTPPSLRPSPNMVMSFVGGMTIGQFANVDPNSQFPNEYSKFLEACVYRVAPFGNTGEETGVFGGLGDEWRDGKKCMERSEELSNFRAYTLYVSVMEMNDEEEETGSGSKVSIGDGDIVKAGELFIGYGYAFGGGHGPIEGIKTLIDNIKNGSSVKSITNYILDCTGFVRASIFAATGVDIGGGADSDYPTNPLLEKVDRASVVPGDIARKPGHAEIVARVEGSTIFTQGAKNTDRGIVGPDDYGDFFSNDWTEFYRLKR